MWDRWISAFAGMTDRAGNDQERKAQTRSLIRHPPRKRTTRAAICAAVPFGFTREERVNGSSQSEGAMWDHWVPAFAGMTVKGEAGCPKTKTARPPSQTGRRAIPFRMRLL